MKFDVLLGLQWGDEGKGKIVDVLTSNYDVIARFQGGPNAGHTLEIEDIQHILHSIPSGVFWEDKINLVGNGVVIDPVIFSEEVNALKKKGIDLQKSLKLSKKAHLILPTHRLLDAASEAAKGKTKIGSTLKGIGPTYMDKTGRNGMRIGDVLKDNFREKYEFLKEKHKGILSQYDFEYDLQEYEKSWFEGIEVLREYQLVDSEYLINEYLDDGRKVLAEGAQGTLLDIDFGFYPFVTSSNTICAGACIGLGVAPHKIGEVMGIFKSYCTRVGSGSFPTELNDQTGEKLREAGQEFGATTGRPRRCGWLDLVALKYAVMLNGVTQLIITKTDVLSEFETIKVCTGYQTNYGLTTKLPYDTEGKMEPVFDELPGWKSDITQAKNEKDLPLQLREYITYIENYLEVPVKMISMGPERTQIIYRR